MYQSTETICEKIEERKPWAGGLVEKIYVNFGVTQFPEMGEGVSDLMENARATLSRAELKGPNTIEVFQENDNMES